jgi:hypothetical protein
VPRPRPVALLALLAVLLAGCRLGVGAEVEVERDGSGTAAIVFDLDPELRDELDELGVDPTAELSAAASQVAGWDVTRTVDEDGSLQVTLTRETADPEALTEAFGELTAGLSDDDPALLVDLDLAVDDEGAATLSGSAQLRPPVGPGVVLDDPAAVADFDAEVAEAVDAALTVTLPGPIETDDADEVDGSTLTWRLPVGEERSVTATSAPPPWWSGTGLLVPGAALLIALSLAALAWVVVRRRRAGASAGDAADL